MPVPDFMDKLILINLFQKELVEFVFKYKQGLQKLGHHLHASVSASITLTFRAEVCTTLEEFVQSLIN